ncbi:proteobacterial dedicated sortase system histidine kinase [Aliiglaciecola sp. LCG003]|uniref:proteobacterial dedicated sortase system histidine kinase n=1 Tax=Aliiglaciecola sp. LCG003 TaxID=3053655 RepID=UPI00257481CC|nr:proteobacterial dedicated sortase system histidine kinase [Aliiglaciecola sp. LCG003]WJG09158.1 proteobacterial dedicated sortase system histidine kinase [Aliiglaciecola sp. LCG003]
MFRLRFGIRLKLLFLSLFLFAIPWLGYKYVWELESYLRIGQEQTMEGTARAVATALHERPSLFDSQSSYLQDVKPGTDLYAHKIIDPIRLDGKLDDWQDYRHLSLRYAQMQLIEQTTAYDPQSLQFEHMVGQYNQYLYAMFEVTDDTLIYRPNNSLRVDRNDYLLIAVTDPIGVFRRYIVAPQQSGWVNAYLLDDNPESYRPQNLETAIQGFWQQTPSGYNIELRFPLDIMSSKIAFAITDVDTLQSRERKYIIGTANPNQPDSLGTVLIPSPEIEKILKGLKYSNARVWVVDKHMRVLARSGSIQAATGVRSAPVNGRTNDWWQRFEQNWLFPLYYHVLTKPPADFVDELENAYALKGKDLADALTGKASSQWRLTPDNKAVILSAAHPIFIDDTVMGAVVVEQTTHGIRTLRNRALEQLFHVILAVVFLGTSALFLFASRISFRIRKLRNQTESAIDENGKILTNIPRSETKDEIGDLSRTFHTVLDKLQQYNSYLENMSARLSHELRTPVAIVKSSLENLSLEQSGANGANGANDDNEKQQYIERAQTGINRLSKILSNMSEATRLEQAIQYSDREEFELSELLRGCSEGYGAAYPQHQFETSFGNIQHKLTGSPELFSQMLDKIIANAVEFSAPGSPISIGLTVKHNQVYLSIANQGPLLPENMHEQLLDSMVSVRRQQDAGETHLGLGLYIAKIIAEYHKGTIRINNQADKTGVEVTISFDS